jgi:hypothetical protein
LYLINNPWPGEGGWWLTEYDLNYPVGGYWEWSDITSVPNTNDDKVTLFDDYNYAGASFATANDVPWLGDYGFNDRTTSVKVRGVPVILYSDMNYGGTGWAVAPGDYEYPLSWAGSWGADNTVSSVGKIPYAYGEMAIVLFEDTYYRGSFLVVSDSNANLHVGGWGDRASSLIVLSKVWNLFTDTGFGGNMFTVTSFGGPRGGGFYPTPSSWGGPNDDASSVSVHDEWSDSPLILYQGTALSGRAVTLWSGDPQSWLDNFTNIGFDNAAGSYKTYANTWTVWPDAYQSGTPVVLPPNDWGSFYPYYSVLLSSASYQETGEWGF